MAPCILYFPSKRKIEDTRRKVRPTPARNTTRKGMSGGPSISNMLLAGQNAGNASSDEVYHHTSSKRYSPNLRMIPFLRNEKTRAETKIMKSQACVRKRREKKEDALRLIPQGSTSAHSSVWQPLCIFLSRVSMYSPVGTQQ
jgi:hypothetical protein